jgi:hypothetical protein
MVLLAVLLAALPGVATPSGNIHCFYVPAKPAHLLCDWELDATARAQPVCAGGILYNSNKDKPVFTTLAYGNDSRLL